MQCIHCGSALSKRDIFCSRCQTPILTQDDLTLMPNVISTRRANTIHHAETAQYDNSTQLHDGSRSTGSPERKNTAQYTTNNPPPVKQAREREKGLSVVTVVIAAACIVLFIFGLYYLLQLL